MTDVGYCRCCGQQVQLEEDYGSEEQNNWEATGRCNCPNSRDTYFAHRRRKTQIKNANENIDKLFVDGIPESGANAVEPESADIAVEMLRTAVVPVVDKLLYKVTISIPGGVQAIISRSGKDKIVVERKDASTQKLES